jgi:hypothetical protein
MTRALGFFLLLLLPVQACFAQTSCGPGGGAACFALPVVVGNPTGGAMGAGSVNAQSVFVNGAAAFSSTVGQIPGTATNDNAAAGNVGEVIASNVLIGAAVALTTATPANITSMGLTAGDWDCHAMIGTAAAATTTSTETVGMISLVSATLGVANTSSFDFPFTKAVGASPQVNVPMGVMRFSFAAPTTIFLVVESFLAVSTNAAYGNITCRRAR